MGRFSFSPGHQHYRSTVHCVLYTSWMFNNVCDSFLLPLFSVMWSCCFEHILQWCFTNSPISAIEQVMQVAVFFFPSCKYFLGQVWMCVCTHAQMYILLYTHLFTCTNNDKHISSLTFSVLYAYAIMFMYLFVDAHSFQREIQ